MTDSAPDDGAQRLPASDSDTQPTTPSSLSSIFPPPPSTLPHKPSPIPASPSLLPSPVRLRYLNLLDHPVTDDGTRQVAQLLFRVAQTPHLEIEGKLGKCIDPSTQRKLRIPAVLDTTVVVDPQQSPHFFQSELDQRVFAHLNDRVLKGRFENEQETARREGRRPLLHYSHPVITDLFYEGKGVDGGTVRVSLDTQGRALSIIKQRLQHLDFLLPPLQIEGIDSIDFRITASQEVPTPVPSPSAVPHRIRRKDRRTYETSMWRVDCTVVETWSQCKRGGAAAAPGGWEGEGKSRVGYEVEVEMMADAVTALRAEAVKLAEKKPNEVVEIARNLLENMRTLAKVALSPPPESCVVRKGGGGGGGGEDRGKKRPREDGPDEKKEPVR